MTLQDGPKQQPKETGDEPTSKPTKFDWGCGIAIALLVALAFSTVSRIYLE